MSYLPNRIQRLLLRAALAEMPSAQSAWREYSQIQGSSSLSDPHLHKLAPELYARSKELVLGATLHSLARKSFLAACLQQSLRNQAFLSVARALTENNIEPLLLKGMASHFVHSKVAPPRQMADVDLMVARKHAREAVAVLLSAGWVSQPEHFGKLASDTPTQYFPFRHSIAFRHPCFRVTLDLHWYALRVCPQAHWDKEFMERSVLHREEGQSFRLLETTDRLFHTLVHGAEWRPIPGVNWVIDAARILQWEGQRIDFQRLNTLAEQRKVHRFVQTSLDFLSTELGFSCRLPKSPTIFIDRLEFSLKSSRLNSPFLGNFPFVVFQHRRVRRSQSRAIMRRYLRYTARAIKFNWGVIDLRHLLQALFAKLLQSWAKKWRYG